MEKARFIKAFRLKLTPISRAVFIMPADADELGSLG